MSLYRESAMITTICDTNKVEVVIGNKTVAVIARPSHVGISEWENFWGGTNTASSAHSYLAKTFTHEDAVKAHEKYRNENPSV